ncbi:MAG TPA: hypothetical protein VFS26_10960 [Solirubrobacterales bacterium]|nr:hypothetical protein [Solirubrobacterales bacterium]
MSARLLAVAGAAAIAVLGLTACESTQQRSAELEKQGEKTLLADSGLKIGRESNEVRALATRILSDGNGIAVVVELRNDSDRNLVDVPILIDVRDAAGKSVYRNDIPGIEPALAAVPYIPAGGEVQWVNDQVLPAGRPKSVEVKVGADAASYAGRLPEIEVSEPQLTGDPVSGIEATGEVVNRTGSEQGRLLLYVVARRDGQVVAAGRGAIEHLKASTKPLHYDVFFIGDPSGAALEISAFPTLANEKTE